MLFTNEIMATDNYYTKEVLLMEANTAMRNSWTMQAKADAWKGTYKFEDYNRKAEGYAQVAAKMFARASRRS